MIKTIIILLVLLISFNCSEEKEKTTNEESSIKTEEVTYTAGGTTLKGFLAYDGNQKDKRPGIIVVHEWWGNNDYSQKRAKMLAELGYVALAIDMYGEGKQADNPDDAGKLATETMSNMKTAKAKFEAGINFLKAQSHTNPKKIAAIGYCFGGGVVLNMAVLGEDLDGVVSFHGTPLTDSLSNPKQIKAKILVCTGGDDPFVPKEQVDKFEKIMSDADIDYKVISYPGALHAFTNPAATSNGKKFNIPIAYNKEADEKSWAEMKEFFKEIFK
jgi:dienelactone hydrolase